MNILFVHGLGASRYDFLLTARRLRKKAHVPSAFAYYAARQPLQLIRLRLLERLRQLALAGDYAVIGHSLGGVLLRDVLQRLPTDVRPPRQLFLLGSPIKATRANQFFNRYGWYKLLAGECGQLVASESAMAAIGLPDVPTTCIVGTRSWQGRWSPWGQQANDGIVLEAELCLDRFRHVVALPAYHPLLPANAGLCDIICERLTLKESDE